MIFPAHCYRLGRHTRFDGVDTYVKHVVFMATWRWKPTCNQSMWTCRATFDNSFWYY